MATCLATRARTLRFSPPPERSTEVDVTADLSPGDAPLPGAGATREEPVDAPCGALDIKAVAIVLESAVAPATACYEEGLTRDPALWGRLGVRIDVNADGSIRSVRQDESRFPDPAVATCVLGALGGLKLPPPVGGAAHFGWGLRFGSLPLSVVTPVAPL